MDGYEFRRRGREMVDYIVDYLDNIDTRRVTPNIEPGYLRDLIPREPPQDPDDWDDIMEDVEKKIMIGVTHWQHPRFHAYFPAGNSYPSILGDMLGDAIGCVGFSWAAAPACTELETIMLDWMGRIVGLPSHFLTYAEGSRGGGVIQTSASECVLDCLLAARTQMIKRLKVKYGDEHEETQLLSKMMAYCSKEAHSCVEKAAMISFVKLRILEPDESCSLRGETLRQAMEEDAEAGLYPFFVSTTLGTTGCCAFDNLEEIGPVCKEYGAWLHVDGAYGGNSFICPEYRYLMRGIEYAQSFNMNPNKWMLVNFDCSLMWVRDRFVLAQALVVDPLYLQHSYSESAIDYRLWFVVRNYGVSGLQEYIRKHCRLARMFEYHVLSDNRFEVCNNVRVGLVCFRLVGSDELNQKLLSAINASGKLHMVPAHVNDKYVIRFCVCAQNATEEDIDYAWKTISKFATDVSDKMKMQLLRDVERQMGGKEEKEEEAAAAAAAAREPKRRWARAYKKYSFVRMVSDPKIYNPAIVRMEEEDGENGEAGGGLSPTAEESDGKEGAADGAGGAAEGGAKPIVRKPSTKRSWVSWPLAQILQSAREAAAARNPEEPPSVPTMRFRNWDARLTLATSAGRQTSSPASSGVSPNSQSGGAEDERDNGVVNNCRALLPVPVPTKPPPPPAIVVKENGEGEEEEETTTDV